MSKYVAVPAGRSRAEGRLDQTGQERSLVRYRHVHGLVSLGVAVMTGLAVLGAWLVVSGAENSRTAPLVTGVFVLALSVPMTLMLCALYLRPLVVTEDHVMVPGVVRRQEIAMTDLAGVGLLYRWMPGTFKSQGWTLELWNASGQRIEVQRFTVSRFDQQRSEDRDRRITAIRGKDPSPPLPNEDPEVLATSLPGRIATDIYTRALEVQGPAGPLATRALQKSATPDRWEIGDTYAWWSPDGSMGRTGRTAR